MGGEVSLRWIYTHMATEYARHCGHADLIRERIDGTSCPFSFDLIRGRRPELRCISSGENPTGQFSHFI